MENKNEIKVTKFIGGVDGREYYNISHPDGAEKNFLVETPDGINEEMRDGAAYLYEQHTLGNDIDWDGDLQNRDDGILQRFEWIMENVDDADALVSTANALINDAKKFREGVMAGDIEGDCRLYGQAVRYSIERIKTDAEDLLL